MESTPIIIGLDIGLVLTIVYVLDRNVFHAIYIVLSGIPTWIELRIRQTILGVRLYLDKQSLRPGPVGRFLRDRELRAIQRNPAYKEFFTNEQVQSQPLPKGKD